MRVAVAGQTREHVETVAREVGGIALTGDVSDAADVEGWIGETASALGPIDVLVNNAGVAGDAEPLAEADPAAWWRVFEINVLGTMLCCRAVLPQMLARSGGRIVNLSSAPPISPTPAAERESRRRTARARPRSAASARRSRSSAGRHGSPSSTSAPGSCGRT
jgi:NADP-dependent 3-hydroxy acid dehydrogenase YdfG